MADVLAELVARITADTTELKKALADSDRAIQGTGAVMEKETKSIAERFKDIGKAATVMGAAITASMGLVVKSAIEEEINIKHLQVALQGVGVSYDNVKDSLEGVISATQRKTGVADSEQRDVLASLLLVTKDYNKALKLLPLALDLAAYSQTSTTSTAIRLGRAYEELEAGADSISIRIGYTAVKFKDLDEVQERVGGTAEAMRNPFKVLQATMKDLSEEIGNTLIPAVKEIINPLVDITLKIQGFIQEQPELTKAIAGAALAMGVLATAIGTVSLAVTFLGAALLPVATAIVVLGGLTAAGIALYDAFQDVGSGAQKVIHPISELGRQLEVTSNEAKKLGAEADKASSKAIQALDKLGTQTVEALKRRNQESEQAEQSSLDDRLRAIQDFYDNAERESEDSHRSIIRDIESQRDAELDAISESLRERERWYTQSVAFYEKDADARLKALRTTTSRQVKDIESQIDAIESQRDAQRKGEQEQRDAQRKAALNSQWMIARSKNDQAEMSRVTEQLAAIESDIRKRSFEEARQAEIQSLRDKIDLIREDERVKETQIKDALQAQKEDLKTELDTFKQHNTFMMSEQKVFWAKKIEGQNEVNEIAKGIEAEQRKLEETNLKDKKNAITAHYKELNKEETLQGEARELILKENQEDLIKLLNDYNPKWQDAGISFGESLVKGLRSTKASMESAVAEIMSLFGGAQAALAVSASATTGLSLDQQHAAEQVAAFIAGGGNPVDVPKSILGAAGGLEGYAHGGIVPGAIGEPHLALVHGGEAITPSGASGINIIFEGPVYGLADFESKVAQAVRDHAVRGGFHGVLQGA